jgi:tRNA threonylcarbamoyladenosine biosynthesis protein TsaE
VRVLKNSIIVSGDMRSKAFLIRIISSSVEHTRMLGEEISRFTQPGSFVFLRGDLGSGKTEFVRGFARASGWFEVRSPSFTIINEYPSDPPIVHADLYRIEKDSIREFPFEEYSANGFVVLVEWADRMAEGTFRDFWEISFHYPCHLGSEVPVDQNERIIGISCCGEIACERMERMLAASEFFREISRI